jgi:hypothetical protein
MRTSRSRYIQKGYNVKERSKLWPCRKRSKLLVYHEVSRPGSIDMVAPVQRPLGTKQRVLGMLRRYAGMAISIRGETIENSLPE